MVVEDSERIKSHLHHEHQRVYIVVNEQFPAIIIRSSPL